MKEKYVLNAGKLAAVGESINTVYSTIMKSNYKFFSWNGDIYFKNPNAQSGSDLLKRVFETGITTANLI